MGWVSSVGPPEMAPILYVHCITCIYHFYDKMFFKFGKKSTLEKFGLSFNNFDDDV